MKLNPVIKYAFAALLLLGSTYSNAATWYTASGGILGTTGTQVAAAWCSATSYCDSMCGHFSVAGNGNETHWYDRTSASNDCDYAGQPYPYGQTITAAKQTGTCPAQLPYEWSDGSCHSDEEQTCGTDSIDVMWVFNPNDPNLTSVPIFHSDGTCLFSADSSVIDDPESCGMYERNGEIVAACKITVTGLGTTGTQADADMQNNGAGTSSYDEEQNLSNQQTTSSSDGGQTTFTKSEPTSNPDGSTTQTTQETTTNTTGSGTEVWYDDQYIYYRDSSGTTTVYDRTKTTTTNADGSSTEVVDTSRTTQTPSSGTTTINQGSGAVTQSSNGSSTTYYDNSTTVNNYDSSGNLTDSTTTSDSGTADEGDPEEQGNCGAPGQPACEITISGEDHLGDPAAAIAGAGIISKFDEYILGMESVGSGDIGDIILDNPLQLPTTGTCNPSSYSVDYHGSNFNGMTKFCQVYDEHLHAMLQFFFYFMTAIAAFLLHHRTITRSS